MQFKNLQHIPYEDALQKMQMFTERRDAHTEDEIWFCEHPPVFTLGRHADPEHIIDAGMVPVIRTDRGGQVTYHGPGQLMMYCLLDLKRKKTGIAALVTALEEIVIQSLKHWNIQAHTQKNKPGVYVNDAKICSIGLRVKEGKTYHGLALNVNMDLQPFSGIHPCGYPDLKMTQMADFVPEICLSHVYPILEQIWGQVEEIN